MPTKVISQETFNKLILALRCADADLQGVQQRYHSCMAPDRHEEDAANLTREEIAIVYKELTGKEINDA